MLNVAALYLPRVMKRENMVVHSAMASATALKLCPDLLLIPGRMNAYREASKQMREIFAEYTDLIEPLSLDEAFLDVSQCEKMQG